MQTVRLSFKEFVGSLVVEELHPELQAIIKSPADERSKKAKVVAKIMELGKRGERTGIEGSMPAGSSRAYLQHQDPHPVTVDGIKTVMKTGTKFAVKATLDESHNKEAYGGLSLGALQNEAENGDHLINSMYRILTKHPNQTFTSNEDNGIFHPLIEHDEENHEWAHVGHAANLTHKRFQELTKTPSHPKGISHSEFCDALDRSWWQMHGNYHEHGEAYEKNLDYVEKHPLVRKFQRHMVDYDAPPYDYRQLGNLGEFVHPITHKSHIVARDHGFNRQVMDAYSDARNSERET